MQHPPGTAPVKAEYLISNVVGPAPDDDSAEGSGRTRDPRGDARDEDGQGSRRRKQTKEEKKAQRGSNKGRRFGKIRDELDLCRKVAAGETCEFGSECRQPHDVEAYLAGKSADIRLPRIDELSEDAPFVHGPDTDMKDSDEPALLGPVCPIYAERGECKYGLRCRFMGSHSSKTEDGRVIMLRDEEKRLHSAVSCAEVNFVTGESLKLMRTRKYKHPIADTYLQEYQAPQNDMISKKTSGGSSSIDAPEVQGKSVVFAEPEQDDELSEDDSKPVLPPKPAVDSLISQRTGAPADCAESDRPDVPVRFAEKKRLNWSGQTYLAPLTTVGNLPFRRLCVSFGADITCGEMGLATSFLQGSKEEWSLVRRHPSERVFGIQIAGNKPSTMVPAAEIIGKECAGNLDFVDINCGCPIDLVFKAGSGSALLDAPAKLGKILVGMNKALGEVPVTVKLRTGVKEGKNTSHKLMPRLSTEWGAGCLTLHGRTRQQRYTKLADWNYIKDCVDAVRSQEADNDIPPIPIFGGGDCYSSQDYWSRVDETGVDGVMVGRGALIKPWIFTEIKERREWDISARERLEAIRQYAEYGISHFGSDTAGVTTTRRYLCEALSFQYRYVPLGLLEHTPGRLNDRAPAFRGRNDLETLLASPDSRDWVKISEMFLGPSPESWKFTPKHKSNSYESNQG